MNFKDTVKGLLSRDTTLPTAAVNKTSAEGSGRIAPAAPISYTVAEWLGKSNPKGRKVTYGVSRDMFRNWFRIADKDGSEIEALNTKYQAYAEEIDLFNLFVTVMFHERWGGFAIIVDWFRFNDLNPPFRYEVFHRNNTTIEFDRNTGEPAIYKVNKQIGDMMRTISVPAEFAQLVATRREFDLWKGSSALEPIYRELLDAWEVGVKTGVAYARFGPGMPFYSSDDTLNPKTRTALNNIIDNFDKVTGQILDKGLKFDFAGTKGRALDPQIYMRVMNQEIAVGSGIPVPMIEGRIVGELIAAEVAQSEYFNFIGGEQELTDGFIREFNIRDGILSEGDWQIFWNDPDVSRMEELEIKLKEIDVEMLEEKAENPPVIPPQLLANNPAVPPEEDPEEPEEPEEDG